MLIRWLLALAWFAGIATIIFLADSFRARGFFNAMQALPGGDKAGHFVLIGAMAFFLNFALRCRTFPALGRRWLLGSAIILALAAVEECSQLWFPHRTFDLGDFVADAAGIWCFGWLARKVARPAN